jgi:site-specific DNA-methyltransferase (adenine-specific)
MTTTTKTQARTVRIDADWRSLRPNGRIYRRSAPAAGQHPRFDLPRNQILLGDAATVLASLPSASVDTVITSPPYFLLRNYNVDGQLGTERDIDGWVAALVRTCDELGRVLAPHGSLWLNLGDSFSRHTRFGAPPKGLLLGPERLLLALAEHGWIVRNKVVWAKPNPMPHSVGDRLSTTWEPIYFLVRSHSYFFDLGRIRVPHRSTRVPSLGTGNEKYGAKRPTWAGPLAGSNDGLIRARAEGRSGHVLGKNPGDVWTIPTAGYRGAHFATFPTRLVERPLLASCPERVCLACGEPWRPVHEREPVPACNCDASWRPGVVLDPFMGAGTVALAANKHHRDWLGIELSAEYRRLALKRLADS